MAKHYQNPVVMFDPKRWSRPAQRRFMEFNIFVNRLLPVRLLHVLNASKSSREWRAKEAERLAKRMERSK